MDGGGGRIQMGQRRRQRRIKLGEDDMENINLGTEPNSPLAYAPGLKHNHPIMSTLGELGGC